MTAPTTDRKTRITAFYDIGFYVLSLCFVLVGVIQDPDHPGFLLVGFTGLLHLLLRPDATLAYPSRRGSFARVGDFLLAGLVFWHMVNILRDLS